MTLLVKLEEPTTDNSRQLLLTNGMTVIVDYPIPDCVLEYIWRGVKWNQKWYAYSTKRLDGTPARIAMHRLIAETSPGEICHHLNRHSLDNREANLLNMTNHDHSQLHGIRKWSHASDKRKAKTRQADPIGKPA